MEGYASDVRIDSGEGERNTADSGVPVPMLSFPHPHHSHLPLTLTLDEELLRRKQFWPCRRKSVEKGAKWGPAQATCSILPALLTSPDEELLKQCMMKTML